MNEERERRAKLNIVVTLICQLLTMVCGIIVPRILITSFGSEAYGATASITQFLAYITLLEGGVSGVARAALYKPLANNDSKGISEVVIAIKKFFNLIAGVFVVYVVILAFTFKDISKIEVFDWYSTFILVIVISISTFAQYFIGISYSILLQAAQRTYISYTINIIATLFNTIFVVFLAQIGSSLIIVKLVSSIVFAMRPVLLLIYVKKKFNLVKVEYKKDVLKDKWTGLGQHIAYFLHSYTDIAVLTLFANLKYVSVYSVYYMVISAIQNITQSFSTGMEAVFGDMYAKRESNSLNNSFSLYETLISGISVILFSVTTVLIIPFIRLYTRGVNDINYIVPALGVLLSLASLIYCFRMPYHSMIIAAGHFRQTKIAAYGEAIINIVSSVILVIKFGIVGVAIGTVLAVSFRFVCYAYYLSKNIINRPLGLWIKRILINLVIYFSVYWLGGIILSLFYISNYLVWVVCGCVVTLMASSICLFLYMIFYKHDCLQLLRKIDLPNIN